MVTRRLFHSLAMAMLSVFSMLATAICEAIVSLSNLAFQEPTMQKAEVELQEHASLKASKQTPTNNGVSINSIAGDFVSMLKAINSRSISSFA